MKRAAHGGFERPGIGGRNGVDPQRPARDVGVDGASGLVLERGQVIECSPGPGSIVLVDQGLVAVVAQEIGVGVVEVDRAATGEVDRAALALISA